MYEYLCPCIRSTCTRTSMYLHCQVYRAWGAWLLRHRGNTLCSARPTHTAGGAPRRGLARFVTTPRAPKKNMFRTSARTRAAQLVVSILSVTTRTAAGRPSACTPSNHAFFCRHTVQLPHPRRQAKHTPECLTCREKLGIIEFLDLLFGVEKRPPKLFKCHRAIRIEIHRFVERVHLLRG